MGRENNQKKKERRMKRKKRKGDVTFSQAWQANLRGVFFELLCPPQRERGT